ncbi:nitrate- and nitrite sensing domain-containing protein [Streptomyces fructofermentans]|uniref:sensor histidine kinase n=1 Tax=Streptomyces fructofermentans TaxID=152141 RepID=UPI0033D47EC4
MRAPVQKMRPRRKGRQSVSDGASGPTPNPSAAQGPSDPAGRGRPAHVRSRLIIAVAVVAAAIAAAGAPSVLADSGRLNDSQNLVTLAERTQDALALAHSLADERDEVTSYLAAGRPEGKGPSERRSARVDRQVDELRADAVEADAPEAFRSTLDGIATVRRAALTGKSTALEAHRAYSAVLTELHALAEELAERLPPRAGGGTHALAELDSAVQQAAATRGLLLAALNVPTTTQTTTDPITGLPVTSTVSTPAATKQRDALSAAAQQANVREQAAVADFRDASPAAGRASFDSTVTGPDVTTAEKYLAVLADGPTLSESERDTSTKKLDAALSARIELMRGVEASLNSGRVKDLAGMRDDDVTALELQIAILGALMLLAVGVATAMARTLTRPLAVLRLGSARLAADPETAEPVKFTGRNDEFAQVVRSVNALHAHARALQDRLSSLEGDRKHLIGQRQKMADERDALRTGLTETTAHLEQVRHSIHGTFVNLALRTLGLVERQLGVIEGLEEREQDPDRLATLFRLDHFATVMRRHSENLLVLAGAEHGHQHRDPVPLVDVVRASVSEIERYERVRIAALPPHAHIAGFAADDISHLVAELLENASSFSPPDIPVEVSGWLLESGEVMLSVQDEGIGMTGERLAQLNARLAEFDPEDAYDQESGEGLGLGLYVVARLAHRHGVRVQLREQKQGGITAVVVLPRTLLAAAPAVAVPSQSTGRTAGGAAAMSLPGADAEVNSNVLYGRPGRDPLIAAAEDSLRDAGGDTEPEADTAPAEPVRDDSPAHDSATHDSATHDSATHDSATHDAGTDDSAPRDSAADGGRTGLAGPGERAATPAPEESPEPAAPEAPSGPETTMVLMAPVLPDEHTPDPGGAPAPGAGTPPAAPHADPYAIGPDAHERTPDAAQAPQEPEDRVTDKGLPKRTPRVSAPTTAARPRQGSVDAEALRRRLGGFHRGANDGRRDVEAEIAEQTSELQTGAGHAVETKGDPVEEASS